MIVKNITKSSIVIDCPAKLNLFLEVLYKREDGYHEIHSLFQMVSLYDHIEFDISDTAKIGVSINSNNAELPTDNSNLICKAFNLLSNKFPQIDRLQVKLEKNIPIAAGLAGGSSNAAATILACNHMYNLSLSRKQMAEISLEIGSDLPFFFSNGQAIVKGRGETVIPSSYPIDYWIVLIKPDISISTAKAYANLNLTLTKKSERYSLDGCQTVAGLLGTLRSAVNDFETVQFDKYPFLIEIKDKLISTGADLVRMSGSGPTIFGIYEEEPDIDQVRSFCQDEWEVHSVRPIDLGLQQ